MNECPCGSCERKGCGEFHNQCTEYIEWKKSEEERKNKIKEAKKWLGRNYIKSTTFDSRVRRRGGRIGR